MKYYDDMEMEYITKARAIEIVRSALEDVEWDWYFKNVTDLRNHAKNNTKEWFDALESYGVSVE